MLEHFIVSGASPTSEPELEALIARIVPAAERATWKGATAEQIEKLEALAERPLPDSYRWFLATLGGAFPHETLGYERQDLRAATVIDAYAKGVAQPDPRYLLIGRIPRSGDAGAALLRSRRTLSR